MSRYLLDTNVFGNVTKPMPSESPVAWLAEQADEAYLGAQFGAAWF